jgi:HK97 gp10 family phage protein
MSLQRNRPALGGAAALHQKLKTLERAYGARGVTRTAVRAAARVVRDEARALLPDSVSAAGRKGVLTQDKNHSDPNTATVLVGVAHTVGRKKKRGSFALLFFETGTKAHAIEAGKTRRGLADKLHLFGVLAHVKGGLGRRRRALRVRSNGEFMGPRVMHPGQRKHPFLAPALERKRTEARAAMERVFAEGLRKKTGGTPSAL